MVITNRDLPVGTVLRATFKKGAYGCTVEADEQGGRRYRLEDGRTFGSPSAAGSAVMKGVACNGWRFWTAEGEEAAAGSDSATPAPTPRGAAKGKLLRVIRKLPNQKGVPEGKTKFFCSSCMSGFVAEGSDVPATCPEGHPAEASDDLAGPDPAAPTDDGTKDDRAPEASGE